MFHRIMRAEAPEGHARHGPSASANSIWPIILAFGITLIFAGCLRALRVSILGSDPFRDQLRRMVPRTFSHTRRKRRYQVERSACSVLLSGEKSKGWPIAPELSTLTSLETYPVSGSKRCLAGSVAWAVARMPLTGLSEGRSIWYPINLLAADRLCSSLRMERTWLRVAVSFGQLLAGARDHRSHSLFSGAALCAMLPMFPRRQGLLEVSSRRFSGQESSAASWGS